MDVRWTVAVYDGLGETTCRLERETGVENGIKQAVQTRHGALLPDESAAAEEFAPCADSELKLVRDHETILTGFQSTGVLCAGARLVVRGNDLQSASLLCLGEQMASHGDLHLIAIMELVAGKLCSWEAGWNAIRNASR
jgi:hypothetical protein